MQQANLSLSGRHAPSAELANNVRQLIAELGVVGASRALLVSRETTTRIAAGAPVRLASLRLAQSQITARKDGEPDAAEPARKIARVAGKRR